MVVQQRLKQNNDVGFSGSCRGLQNHRLIEPLNRALHAMQPVHDGGRRDGPDAIVHIPDLVLGQRDHPGQPGHGLLHEDVPRTAQDTSRPRPAGNLHRQNTVAAEVEERVVGANPINTEHLGIYAR
ncbi:Uncharacterised protein [Mycobacteroides abscessus]|nr:Uncharacterised protein [Mycobacteroides abscessus]